MDSNCTIGSAAESALLLQCSEPMLVDNLTVSSLYGKCSFDSYDQASISLLLHVYTQI